MEIELGRSIILVHDYDEAFEFYEQILNAQKYVDYTTDDGQRFLHVVFESKTSGIWFLKAAGREQFQLVGNQTQGQPTLVFYTDDIQSFYRRLVEHNVHIKREIVSGNGYHFLHFLDLYGNELVMVELKAQTI
ncbi:bleomycin resistance protein [Solitalea longa]|uniref:Bleomycin resistance protein n=1 Tax=Solitalea longa TaxID=2079460 RepID=A0A2S5A9L8_9SPHI|nr:VOC family protein [Solitalea longa]POY38947.1 bleomycin resistance protein [Solitalea longa]